MSKRLPSVSSQIPRDLRSFLDRVRELISGGGRDRLLTAGDLSDAGIAQVDGAGNLLPAEQEFLATPPAPGNVAAIAAIRNIIVSWDAPAYRGHAYAEVWVSSTDDLGAAVLLGMSPGSLFVHGVGPSSTRYYWVRFVNINDVKGPYNDIAGTDATTGGDTAYTLGVLANSITSSELSSTLNSRIDLIDGPAATIGTIPNQLAFLQGQIDAINAYPDYDNSAAYAEGDIVKYDGGLFKATQATTGNLPTDEDYWLKIGDYSSLADVVAAHTAQISTLTTDLGGEVSARETLATQMRGAYTGTDIASLTSGLLYSERVARADADTGLASSISAVSATAASKARIFRQTSAPVSPSVNDIWVDTKPNYAVPYFAEDYSTPRYNQYQWNGVEWLDITLTDITDNYALIITEQTARATADEAFAQSITTLETAVNDPATGLAATRATLINDYSTTSTVNSAIANSKTTLKAYADIGSKVFRQPGAPTARGVDPDTAANIPLQIGDAWIDIDDDNKFYLWDGAQWVYSPDQAITGAVSDLSATLTNDYLTAVDTNGAISQSATFLRAYADNTSTVFRQADEPTKRGVDAETAVDIPLRIGDAWVDTTDDNKFYLWDGAQWVYSPDGAITGAIEDVDARVTTVETAKIGYCTIDGVATDDINRADCEAAGGVWNQGLPISTAVKQVAVTDANGDTAVIEQAFTAQKDLNDQFKLQYTIKLDVNGNVTGYGLYNTGTSSSFIINADRFAVTTPQTSIPLRVNNTPYSVGQIVRISGVDDKTLVCKKSGTSGASTPTPGALGTLLADGSVRWQVASRVPFAVQAAPQEVAGVAVPAGMYVDAAYILNATIQNAQIADLAVDNAKIADLSVGKLIAGSIAADQYIQSSNFSTGSQGFRLSANGNAEFQNIVARGTIYATAGEISGSLIAGEITAGTISADKISGGTFSGASIAIASSVGGWLLNAGNNGTVVGYRQLNGYNIFAGNLAAPASPAITGQTDFSGEGVRGTAVASNSSSTAHGIRGSNQNKNTSGLVGAANTYDFYADGAGVNYGPFTGSHDALLPLDEAPEQGDIMVDTGFCVKGGVSQVITEVRQSTVARSPAAVGVFAANNGPLADAYTPAALFLCPDEFYRIKDSYNYGLINSLGEGVVNVCNEGGDIAVGDLIVTSSTPGKGMRQADDVIRSYTVAKARENVTFSGPADVKQVACIYLCG